VLRVNQGSDRAKVESSSSSGAGYRVRASPGPKETERSDQRGTALLAGRLINIAMLKQQVISVQYDMINMVQ
jgi:hypothetical protein